MMALGRYLASALGPLGAGQEESSSRVNGSGLG